MSTFSGMPVENSFHWKVGRENKRSLTASQKGFIFNNHNKMTIQQMAMLLGKSYSTVARYVSKYNLITKTQHYGKKTSTDGR
jgi:transposase